MHINHHKSFRGRVLLVYLTHNHKPIDASAFIIHSVLCTYSFSLFIVISWFRKRRRLGAFKYTDQIDKNPTLLKSLFETCVKTTWRTPTPRGRRKTSAYNLLTTTTDLASPAAVPERTPRPRPPTPSTSRPAGLPVRPGTTTCLPKPTALLCKHSR